MDNDKMHEGLESGRCTICHFMEKDESDLLCKWAGAGENIYKGLRAGEVFCNLHFWRMKKAMSDVTAAALNGFLLEQFVSELDSTDVQLADAWLRDYQDRQSLSGHVVCPVCRTLFGREKEYIEAVVAFLADRENMQTYQKSRGLCIPHFIKVFLSVRDDLQRERIWTIQKTHTTVLMEELQEFIRKQLPPLKWERTGDEKLAYWRSLEKLVGRTGTKWL